MILELVKQCIRLLDFQMYSIIKIISIRSIEILSKWYPECESFRQKESVLLWLPDFIQISGLCIVPDFRHPGSGFGSGSGCSCRPASGSGSGCSCRPASGSGLLSSSSVRMVCSGLNGGSCKKMKRLECFDLKKDHSQDLNPEPADASRKSKHLQIYFPHQMAKLIFLSLRWQS